jgi:hypothetical protein
MSAAQHVPGRYDLRRLVAMLGLLGLLFHTLLPLTQNAIRHVQAANGIEQVVLCSALGFRIIALKDGLPADIDPEKPAKVSQTCPVCFAAQVGHAILPAGILLLLPGFSLTALYGAAPGSTPAQSLHQPQQARAPPVSRS